jgi:hypothetical protein
MTQITPSIVTVVEPLIKPVPTIVITTSSVNLPVLGVTVLTRGTLFDEYVAAADTVESIYPLT